VDNQRASGHEQNAPAPDESPVASGERLEGSGFELDQPEEDFEEEQ
jgi:hypothetical protein